MYEYIKKLMFLLDPENAHNLAEFSLKNGYKICPFAFSLYAKKHFVTDEALHQEIEGVIDEIGIDSAKYIFVSTGDSEENISTALKIVEKAKESSNKKLLVHIENRTLRSLYND